MAPLLRTRARITGTTGLPGLSTFYWIPTTAGSTEATAALAGVRSYFEAVKGLLAPAVTITYDQAVDVINDATGVLENQLTATAQSATTSTGTASAPPANQLGLTLNTGQVVAGRVLRGRTFLGPVDTGAFTAGGVPTGTAKTTLGTGGAALLAVGPPDLAVWHRPKNGSGGLALGVVGVAAATEVWVLRSRRD